MIETTVRRARAADADRLTELIQDSATYRGDYAAMIDGYRVTPEYIARHEVSLASDPATDHLLGFYALIREPAELDLMFVADPAQGRGVGQQLIAHMLERAREAGITAVKVVSHPPAERFYLRMGAERVGTSPARGRITWDRPELRFTV
ncbi:GNAT superfamily N-acetyltransferase [Kitasatospora sp. MAA19]|uniref:GNAT family N-acetyltransferase n=1 Tax=unclassified Kitasatospora TaxID=2633591 RepID=UPI0024769968|nr:GNAT family N-acetyltransferase [Kitasatospora sp. MAA19]MDH6711191.1 GNAT superfamily N-acetyltransferase [Kitasatospora sp. MAA19]